MTENSGEPTFRGPRMLVGTMEVTISVECDRCHKLYSYPFTIRETLRVDVDTYSRREELSRTIEMRRRGTNLGFQPCPLCGSTQRWMKQAVAETAGNVVLALGAMVALIVFTMMIDFPSRRPGDDGAGSVCMVPFALIALGLYVFRNFSAIGEYVANFQDRHRDKPVVIGGRAVTSGVLSIRSVDLDG